MKKLILAFLLIATPAMAQDGGGSSGQMATSVGGQMGGVADTGSGGGSKSAKD